MHRISVIPRFFIMLPVIIAMIYAIALLGAFLMQDRFVYHPTRSISRTPKDVGLDFTEVSLKTEDGETLSAWFMPANAPLGVVVFCHGNGGNVSHYLETVRMLHDLRLDTLIFDYRGYGKSTGRPSEMGTYRDAEAAWHYLTKSRGMDPKRVVVFGRSLGGAVACNLASRHGPAALIVESTFTSLRDAAATRFRWLPVRLICRFRYDSAQCVSHLGCPKLFIHSPDDRLVPFQLGRALYERAAQPKEFLETTGGHNSLPLETNPRFREQLEAFLRKSLDKKTNG